MVDRTWKPNYHMADFCVWKTLGAPFPRVLLCCPGPAINLIKNPFSIHWQTFLRQAWGTESTDRDSAYPLRSSFRTHPHIPHSKWLCSPNRAGLSEFHVHAPGSESPPFHLGPDTNKVEKLPRWFWYPRLQSSGLKNPKASWWVGRSVQPPL